MIYAAASAATNAWRGATLYVERSDNLIEIAKTDKQRAIVGQLAHALEPLGHHVFEATATLEMIVTAADAELPSTDLAGMANGANRLLVGGEVLQFLVAERVSLTHWRLSGLLRGRAGTEPESLTTHPVGTSAVILDDKVTSLDPLQVVPLASSRIAAIGTGDAEPVEAELRNPGLSRRPPVPVHPMVNKGEDETWQISWLRRARGEWRWDYSVEVPLVEETESYLVGYGPVEAAHATWLTRTNSLSLSSIERSSLLNDFGPAELWVKQLGTYVESPPLKLLKLA
jgi:hypothetical protein